jgi:branched-chain amino acid transport system permease protein
MLPTRVAAHLCCGPGGDDWRRVAVATRVRLIFTVSAFGILVSAGAALAQETPPAPPDDPTTTIPAEIGEDAGEGDAGGQRIAGRLQAGAEPVPGVRITVEAVDVAADPDFSAEAESGDDGAWSVTVPGPGRYRVALDTDTIPEGFALRNPDRAELANFPVFPGATVRTALFPFEAGDGGGRLAIPSRFERLSSLFVSGIRLGLIIGLVSVGLSLVYGTTGLVNFAHGELVTLGGLLAYFWSSSAAGPEVTLVVAGLLAVVLSGLFGAGLELGLWRPMTRRRTGAVARMLVSIGLALFLRHLFQVIFASGPRSFREYATQPPIELGPLRFPASTWIVMGICLVTLVAVGIVLQRTRLGTAIRAVADERELAAASGIDVRRVIVNVWVGGTALAGLGGIMLGITQAVQWNMGFRLLLTMFAAVVLGGLGSAYGAMAGGLVVGIAAEVGTYWIAADFKFAVALTILIVVLLVRPQGILGVRERIG